MKPLLLGVALLATTTACDAEDFGGAAPTQPDTTIQGGLARTTFTYGCAALGDAQCDADSDLAPVRSSSPFPRIAVGGTLELTATASIDYRDLTVDAVSAEFIAPAGDGRSFTAKRAGVVSVTAVQGGIPVDFATIELVKPARLKLLRAKPDGDFRGVDVDLSGGDVSFTANQQFTFKFRAVTVDEKDEILAGALPCQWTTSDEAVARITSDPLDNIVTVVSGAAGAATVAVKYGSFEGSVRVEVGP